MPTSKAIMQTFSSTDLIKEAYQVFKKNWKPFIILLFCQFLLQLIPSIILAINSSGQGPFAFVAIIISVITPLVNAITSFMLVSISIAIVQGKTIKSFQDYVAKMNRFLPYIWLNAVLGLIVLIGFLLFIIPGIIWTYKYLFAIYVQIDDSPGVRESLNTSAQITEGIKWKLFTFGLTLALFNFLGALALGFGLLITIPVTLLAMAMLYEKLKPENLRQPIQNHHELSSEIPIAEPIQRYPNTL